MKVHILSHAAGHQFEWGNAFASGLQKHGIETKIDSAYVPADLVVFWGIRKQTTIAQAKKDGCEICILERGYVGDRFKWTSVSFGGNLNGRANFRGPFSDGSRWKKHFAHLMQPWRKQDGYALIMGQTPGDMSVRGVDLDRFYADAKSEFEARGFKTKFRPHPNVSQPDPMEEDFAGAACAVTWNSNSGVDAVLAGIPIVAMDAGSMVREIAGHELKMPPVPDRTPWAHKIAWCQWSMQEMASGYCWDIVGRHECAQVA